MTCEIRVRYSRPIVTGLGDGAWGPEAAKALNSGPDSGPASPFASVPMSVLLGRLAITIRNTAEATAFSMSGALYGGNLVIH